MCVNMMIEIVLCSFLLIVCAFRFYVMAKAPSSKEPVQLAWVFHPKIFLLG